MQSAENKCALHSPFTRKEGTNVNELLNEYKAKLEKAKAKVAQEMNTSMVDGLHSQIVVSVQQNVYSAYEKKLYERRDMGGIMSPNYNELTKEASPNDLSIEIENKAPGNPDFSPTDSVGVPADAVEHGGPWNYRLSPDPGPRPFMEEAAEMYVQTGEAGSALQQALNSIQ
jgi:hypothetical protein